MSATSDTADRCNQISPVTADAAHREAEIRRLMETYQVCRRTARRHLARGTEPCADRRRGGDLKFYPAYPSRPGQPWSPLSRALKTARSNIRRAARIADADGLYDFELAILTETFLELGKLLFGFAPNETGAVEAHLSGSDVNEVTA